MGNHLTFRTQRPIRHIRLGRPVCFFLVSISAFALDQSVNDKAWTVLQTGLHDKKADKRAQSVSALGVMQGNRRAIDAAEQALEDPDSNVRVAAVTALGVMNSKSSIPKLKALVDQANAETVVAIAAVLTKFKDPEGYGIYYQIVTGKRKGGGSILDGIKDRKALEKIGVRTAIGFVPFSGIGTGAYDYFKQYSTSQAALYVTSVTALAEDPDPVAERALIDSSFSDTELVQVAALRALAKRGNPRVVNNIEGEMDDEKSLVSYTAAATVLHLLDVRARRSAKYDRQSGHAATQSKPAVH